MFRKGKYDIVYQVENEADAESAPRSRFWAIAFAAAVIGGAFFYTRGCFRRESPPPAKPVPTLVRELGDAKPEVAPVAPVPRVADEERRRKPAVERSGAVKSLLDRLDAARRAGDIELEIDTLERLRARKGEVADIDDALARRLGNLNRRLLEDGSRSTPWTVPFTVRGGDTVHQIARENGNTAAAVLWLNGIEDPRKLRVGGIIRVLNRPKVRLEVHSASGIADLVVNGRFFRRYDVSVPPECALGERLVTRAQGGGPRQILAEMGAQLSDESLNEIAMFLAPDSRITVLNP